MQNDSRCQLSEQAPPCCSPNILQLQLGQSSSDTRHVGKQWEHDNMQSIRAGTWFNLLQRDSHKLGEKIK